MLPGSPGVMLSLHLRTQPCVVMGCGTVQGVPDFEQAAHTRAGMDCSCATAPAPACMPPACQASSGVACKLCVGVSRPASCCWSVNKQNPCICSCLAWKLVASQFTPSACMCVGVCVCVCAHQQHGWSVQPVVIARSRTCSLWLSISPVRSCGRAMM